MEGTPEAAMARTVFALLHVVIMSVCFGRIAGRLGRNALLFGVLFLVPLVNLAAMAVLAFGGSSDEPRSGGAP
jgi:hypothetical protein